MAVREGKSPYARGNKRPYEYSGAYDAWHRAVVAQSQTARTLAVEHTAWIEKNVGPLVRINDPDHFRAAISAIPKRHYGRSHRLSESRE